MNDYGLPYMGSKAKICKNICRVFPRAENFYDLFGGGFSITDFMLRHRSKDYKQFHFNEIRPGICDLIKDAINGKFNYKVFKPEWISREDFFKRKDTEAYIKIIWSFGNNGEDYLFGKDIEQYKKSMHNAIIFNKFDDLAKKILGLDKFRNEYSIYERRLYLRNRAIIVNDRNLKRGDLERLQQLQQLERLQQLQQLEQLERLQQLQQLQQLEFYNTSYENIEIKKDSVIYCDIPYKNTVGYDDNKFDRKSFLDWADMQENPVFISEYQNSDNRFKEIFSIKKRSLLNSGAGSKDKLEKLYVNKAVLRKLINKT